MVEGKRQVGRLVDWAPGGVQRIRARAEPAGVYGYQGDVGDAEAPSPWVSRRVSHSLQLFEIGSFNACLIPRMAFDLGGRENLTEAQQQLIRRCAMISAQCELMEQETVGGKPLNAIAYGTLTGHLTRTLNALGLKREPIDLTPALHEYLDTLPAETQDLVAAADESEG